MNLEEKHEELLESIWINTRERNKTAFSRTELGDDGNGIVDELIAEGYVHISDDQIGLTSKGEPLACNVIRRHRLAERLLADILDTNISIMDEKACKFEHILDLGLDDSNCTLLGHPKICPHGKPIPPGRCCLENQNQPLNLVSPLSKLNQGQKGKVAYVHAPEINQLQKLMAMGVLPGAPIELVQNFPSYVFKVRQSQFAVDGDIADAIYVRLTQDDESSSSDPRSTSRRKRRRFGWRKRPNRI
ncbi:MAG: metal-dependent transcriptional regulator [Dehalococcoidales bacterium]|nr:MAG: metal-dependent transcriptional regulator [Dehalococcoidales bacterium]